MIIGTAERYLREVLSKEENEKVMDELRDKYTADLIKEYLDVEVTFTVEDIENYDYQDVKIWVLDRGNKAHELNFNVDKLEFYLERNTETLAEIFEGLIRIGKGTSYLVSAEEMFVHNLVAQFEDDELYVRKADQILMVGDEEVYIGDIDSIAYDNEDNEIFMISNNEEYFINLMDATVHIEY